MKKLYVGNLPFNMTEQELEEVFAAYGNVQSAKLIRDRMTDRPKGFGFVEMDDDAADEAISALNDAEVGGRKIRVDEANDDGGSRGGPRGGGNRGGGHRGGSGGGGGGGGGYRQRRNDY